MASSSSKLSTSELQPYVPALDDVLSLSDDDKTKETPEPEPEQEQEEDEDEHDEHAHRITSDELKSLKRWLSHSDRQTTQPSTDTLSSIFPKSILPFVSGDFTTKKACAHSKWYGYESVMAAWLKCVTGEAPIVFRGHGDNAFTMSRAGSSHRQKRSWLLVSWFSSPGKHWEFAIHLDYSSQTLTLIDPTQQYDANSAVFNALIKQLQLTDPWKVRIPKLVFPFIRYDIDTPGQCYTFISHAGQNATWICLCVHLTSAYKSVDMAIKTLVLLFTQREQTSPEQVMQNYTCSIMTQLQTKNSPLQLALKESFPFGRIPPHVLSIMSSAREQGKVHRVLDVCRGTFRSVTRQQQDSIKVVFIVDMKSVYIAELPSDKTSLSKLTLQQVYQETIKRNKRAKKHLLFTDRLYPVTLTGLQSRPLSHFLQSRHLKQSMMCFLAFDPASLVAQRMRIQIHLMDKDESSHVKKVNLGLSELKTTGILTSGEIQQCQQGHMICTPKIQRIHPAMSYADLLAHHFHPSQSCFHQTPLVISYTNYTHEEYLDPKIVASLEAACERVIEENKAFHVHGTPSEGKANCNMIKFAVDNIPQRTLQLKRTGLFQRFPGIEMLVWWPDLQFNVYFGAEPYRDQGPLVVNRRSAQCLYESGYCLRHPKID